MIRGVLNRQVRFLTIDEVLTLHETAIDEHGGSQGIRDSGLLESALAMPQQGFGGGFAHEYPFGMAAAYAFHLCKNHPFVDGNKRAALAAMFTFLGLNGWSLAATQEDSANAILRVAEGAADKAALAAWIEGNVRARPSIELRDFFAGLSYEQIAQMLNAALADEDAARSQQERFTTMMEAGRAIPAIHEANIGAMRAREEGVEGVEVRLLAQSALLIAIYRIAEDMGYEW